MNKVEEKKNTRFLKKITILCAVMNIIITVASLTISIIKMEISTGTLSVLLGAWSFELTLSAFIKKSENDKKVETEQDSTSESI